MTTANDGYGSESNTFNPSLVTITRAGTVTWSNSSGVTHNVTFSPAAGAPQNVPDLPVGSVSRSFPSAGTFSYRCTNHENMNGQVVVQ